MTLSKEAPEYWRLMALDGPTALTSPSLDEEIRNFNTHNILITATLFHYVSLESPQIRNHM